MATNQVMAWIVRLQVFISILGPIAAVGSPPVPVKCQREADPSAAFTPRAVTLRRINVRTTVPEYSLLRGQWESPPVIQIIEANTCLQVLERRLIGNIQIWYRVRYKASPLQVRQGWVWGGTEGIDDTQYIGGDTTPEPTRPSRSVGAREWWSIVAAAYAQGDTPPAAPQATGISSEPVAAQESFVDLPIIRWRIKLSTASTILLFLAMVLGMIAKAVWDQTENNRLLPTAVQLARPVLISPITFSAFLAAVYVERERVTVSLTSLLFAFQIGFMWQHVLERTRTILEVDRNRHE